MPSHSVLVTIAGPITSVEAIEAIASAVEDHRLALDWGGPSLDAGQAIRAIIDAAETVEVVQFFDDDRNSASVDMLEAACRKHGVAYSIHCDADNGEDACIVTWMPGWAASRTTGSDADYRILVDAENIEELLAAGNKAGLEEYIENALVAGGRRLPAALEIDPAVMADLRDAPSEILAR